MEMTVKFLDVDEPPEREDETATVWVDPRIWNEAMRRGIQGRLNAVLANTEVK
jgi:hypothetical protein